MKKRLSPVLILAGFINLILFIIKYYIGVHTNSLCIYTDSVNNLMDTLSLCLALVGISFLNKPATDRFKFGFGKMESITTFIMSLIMTVAGCSFAYNSLSRFMAPVPVWYFTKYAFVLGITCLVKLSLGVIFTFRYKRNHSPVLKTVMLDSYLDCAITLITLVSFTLSSTMGFALDSVLGLAISIIIAILGIRLIISSISDLIGLRNADVEEKVSFLVKEVNADLVIKDINVHSYGDENLYVTLNLSLTDKNIDFLSVQNTIKNRLKTELNCYSNIEWEVFS